MFNPLPRTVAAVLQQHIDDAIHIRKVRSLLMRAPHVALRHLAHFDMRLAAHIHGILTAASGADAFCAAALEAPDAGTGFMLTVRALESGRTSEFGRLFAVATALPDFERGVMSAFGWVGADRLRGTVAELLKSEVPLARAAGVAACAMHAVDSGLVGQRRLLDSDVRVRARALRAAGMLGLTEAAGLCETGSGEPGECGFWAAWSAVLLGARGNALHRLMSDAIHQPQYRDCAITIAVQAAPTTEATQFLQSVSSATDDRRSLIRGFGVLGDQKFIPWLIKQMSNPEWGRLAGEAFTMITGADLDAEGLAREAPEGAGSGPTDDADDPNVALDPDDDLPWPDSDKVEAWWAANASRFPGNVRYFMGDSITREHCLGVLRAGYQRQRVLAAQHLSLLEPGTPLFNTSAPAWRQQRLLAKMS